MTKLITVLSSLFQINNFSYSKVIHFVTLVFTCLIIFLFPLSKSILLNLIPLWILSWLLEGKFVSKFKANFQKSHLVIFSLSLFYILQAIGYFYSSNKGASLFDLEVKFLLFLFPIIISTSNKLLKKNSNLLYQIFIFGNLLASIICMFIAFFKSSSFINGEYIFNTAIVQDHTSHSFFNLVGNRASFFSYVEFSVFHHPAYFSMYIIFAMVLVYNFYRNTLSKKRKTIYSLLFLFFYINIYLLSTRSGLLALFAVLIALTVLEIIRIKKIVPILIISLILNFGLYKAMKVSPLSKNTSEVSEALKGNNPSNKPNSDLRLTIWKNAIELIKKSPIIGFGNGDVKEALIEKYNTSGFELGVSKKFNAHNQYIETLLAGGIISLFSLLLILGGAFYTSIRKSNIPLAFFIFLIGFNFLFESMLNVIAGVVFISGFYGLLIYYPPSKKNIT